MPVPAQEVLEVVLVQGVVATAAMVVAEDLVAQVVVAVKVEPRQVGVPHRCHEFAYKISWTGEEAR